MNNAIDGIKYNSIGGMGGSATPGGYNQGATVIIPAQVSGGTPPAATKKELRGGSSNSVSGYNQGGMVAGKVGGEGKGLTNIEHKDLRGGNSNPASGYNQGTKVAAGKR